MCGVNTTSTTQLELALGSTSARCPRRALDTQRENGRLAEVVAAPFQRRSRTSFSKLHARACARAACACVEGVRSSHARQIGPSNRPVKIRVPRLRRRPNAPCLAKWILRIHPAQKTSAKDMPKRERESRRIPPVPPAPHTRQQPPPEIPAHRTGLSAQKPMGSSYK